MATAEVILWGRTVGAVTDNNGYVEFSYNPSFIGAGIELAPLAMPVNNTIYSFPEFENRKPYYGLPGMLSDSLPDSFGNYLIKEYLKRYSNGRTSLTPVEKLCYAGSRGMGALEYKPVFEEAKKCENIDIAALTELAEKILSNRKDIQLIENENAMQQLFQVGTSAGGARAKALIAWNEKTGEIRSGQVDSGKEFGYWLLKFDRMTNNTDREIKPDDIDSTKVEYAYYLMAKDSGIQMSESRLYRDGECAHFITKRFDRYDGYKKLHMISLVGMAHLEFQDTHIYDYTDVTRIIDRLGLGSNAIEDIFRRMVFSDIVYNYDDHVKNVAFLMNQQGEWSLSPAFDMTFAFDKNGRFTNIHQMSINHKFIDVTYEDYRASGKQMGLKPSKINSIIDEVRFGVSNFVKYAESSGIREERMHEIQKLIKAKLS